MRHLYWHKKRLVILQLRIEGLPDDHPCKPVCLFYLSRLFSSVGNWVEQRRLLIHALKLQRGQGGDYKIAMLLKELSGVNQLMGLHREGIKAVKEALGIFKRLGETVDQATCLIEFASLFRDDKQFDVAEGAALRAIGILPEKGKEPQVCRSHQTLGEIYRSKGEIEKAIHHYELALEIASPFNWHNIMFWTHYRLAQLFRREDRFEDAQAHVEHAKSHAADSVYNLGYATEEQAWVWYGQDRFEEAKSEALRAANIYDKLGAAKDVEDCRKLLRYIDEELNTLVVSSQSEFNCEFLQMALFLASINFPLLSLGNRMRLSTAASVFQIQPPARVHRHIVPSPCLPLYSLTLLLPSYSTMLSPSLFVSHAHYFVFAVLPLVISNLSLVMHLEPCYRMLPIICGIVR